MVDPLVSVLGGLGAAGLVLVVASAVIGGVAHTAVGFGAAFATVPALALVAPDLLPGAMLVAMLPLTGAMVLSERRTLDRPAATRLLIARIPGIAIGTALVVLADVRWLTVVVGVTLLLGVAAAGLGWSVEVTPRREWAAGMVSGVTGAAVALGGPPLALLYRDRDPAVIRPTLAVVWVVGIAMTLGSLSAVGELNLEQVVLGGLLATVVIAGFAVGRRVIARVDKGAIRTAMLWWAGVGGAAALARALFG